MSVPFASWPQEQRDMMSHVAAGIVDGNLQPLADYFRAGFTEIEPALARELADMIDSQEAYTLYRIQAVGRRRGEIGWSAASDFHHRKLEIGVFMEDRVRRYGRGGYEAALADTKQRFEIGSSATIAKAHKYLRDYMTKSETKPGWDHWAHLKDFYLTP